MAWIMLKISFCIALEGHEVLIYLNRMHTLTILNFIYRSSLIMKLMNWKPLSQWNFVPERLEHGYGWTNLNLMMIRPNLWSLEVHNSLKRLVLQNCPLVTSALLLLVLHEILEFCLIEIWSLMFKLQKHVYNLLLSAQYKKDQEILNVGFNQMFGSCTGNRARRLL